MPETPETAGEIQEIRYRLEAIEATQNMLVRSEADALLKKFLPLFAETADLSAVYKAVDGTRTQAEILGALRATGLKISQPTLSRRMEILRENGLIDLVPSRRNGDVYQKNQLAERLLQLSKRIG